MAGVGKTASSLAETVGGELVAGPMEDPLLEDVTHDSRQAGPGVMFVAVRGAEADGHDFVSAAVKAGSPAVCVEHRARSGVAEIVVGDSRAALGPLAASVHDEPSRDMEVVGVTGTNGKTTVTHYLESIASTAGRKTGLIGTVATHIGRDTISSVHTTPEASDFQRLLARMRDSAVEIVAAEVSSHALDLGRVSATSFAVAAFTNFSQDHLDFHGDMESYRKTKQRLFSDFEVGTAVINIDDELGREIANGYEGSLLRVGSRGDVGYGAVTPMPTGTAFEIRTPGGAAEVVAPVIGSFNVDNAVLAAACGLAVGLELNEVVAGLEVLGRVPGRFEVISGDDPILVIVDYAHTPDGVRQAISAARRMGSRRVIALIGAGGDRDPDKRPLMGAAVSAADFAVVTSDNPRSENPTEIAEAVLTGLEPGTSSTLEIDRARAIAIAIDEADDGDMVLVLGRGHESMQEIAGEKRPFDDRRVAREALLRRRSADSVPNSGSMTP